MYDPLWQGMEKAWDVRGAAPRTGDGAMEALHQLHTP